MPDDRIELVRRLFELYLAGDAGAWLDMLHPDIELDVDDAVIEQGGSYRGREEFAQWAQAWDEMWEDVSYEPEEFFEAGDALVVGVRQRARGAGSGVPIDQTGWWVFEFEGAQVRRTLFYSEKEPALTAAGLTPEDT